MHELTPRASARSSRGRLARAALVTLLALGLPAAGCGDSHGARTADAGPAFDGGLRTDGGGGMDAGLASDGSAPDAGARTDGGGVSDSGGGDACPRGEPVDAGAAIPCLPYAACSPGSEACCRRASPGCVTGECRPLGADTSDCTAVFECAVGTCAPDTYCCFQLRDRHGQCRSSPDCPGMGVLCGTDADCPPDRPTCYFAGGTFACG